MSQESIHSLRTWIAEQGLDAFIVTQPQNRSYMSGWLSDDAEGAGILLVSQQQQIVMTSTLFQEVAANEAVGWQVFYPSRVNSACHCRAGTGAGLVEDRFRVNERDLWFL